MTRYQMFLYTPEINLKTDRRNSISEGREEATSEKVRSAETWFIGEKDLICCGGEGAMYSEKGKKERSTWGHTKRMFLQRH